MKNNSLHRYCLELLRKAECERNCYTSNDDLKEIVASLEEHFGDKENYEIANKRKHSLEEIAKELMAIGDDWNEKHPDKPLRYRVAWDNESCSDAIEEFSNFERAKDCAIGTLVAWMEAQMTEECRGKPNRSKRWWDDEWDRMIFNCSAWVQRFSKDKNEYEDYWYPSDNDLKKIGWVMRLEENK